MSRARITLSAFTVVALSTPASAQSVTEVLDRHFQALGGLEKLKAAQTFRMTGRMTLSPGMEATFLREQKRPNQFRLEFTLQGMTGIQAYDGQTAWMQMPMMGQPDPAEMPPDLARAVKEEAEFDGPLMDYAARGSTVELAGKEPVDGTESFKIKLTRKNGEVTWYYLDAQRYLPVKSETQRTIQGTAMATSTTYSDYRGVAGLLVPHTVQISGAGAAVQTLTIEKVEVNVPLDDGRFRMPRP
jgi:outer membrane lipoprotein-sorting protein